jgi:hypothetical protein
VTYPAADVRHYRWASDFAYTGDGYEDVLGVAVDFTWTSSAHRLLVHGVVTGVWRGSV